jgi:uncharacterized protein (DUF488 family)
MSHAALYTIGFTRSTAERFFTRLADAGVRTVVDVRLRTTSQLAGFAKTPDLAWFLRETVAIGYRHEPLLAPTPAMLDDYRKRGGDWPAYARRFTDLMAQRRIEARLDPDDLAGACLLCSEADPHRCHRRLVADYLNARWEGGLAVTHL